VPIAVSHRIFYTESALLACFLSARRRSRNDAVLAGNEATFRGRDFIGY
jgi:hypothetical protein